MPKRPITPLWIIALFVSLTEAVLSIAVTQTSSNIQLILTVFVITFPLLIAIAFFTILWNRPYVFYPPTEFGSDTDVETYVGAMQRNAMDQGKLFSNIQDTIRSTITSKAVLSELSTTLLPHLPQKAKADIGRALQSAVTTTVDKIRQVSFFGIDTYPILGAKDGYMWDLVYEGYPTVSSLLDLLYAALKRHLSTQSYGKEWLLRDAETGHLFKNMGRTWAGNRADTCSLAEVGIKPGMTLEVIKIKHNSSK